MSHTPPGNQHGARNYELRLQGHLEDRWAAYLDAVSLVNMLDGTSTVLVSVPDQAALHGLLHKVRDLGLPLVSVTRGSPTVPATHPSVAISHTSTLKGNAMTDSA